jgi:hypothetical protein
MNFQEKVTAFQRSLNYNAIESSKSKAAAGGCNCCQAQTIEPNPFNNGEEFFLNFTSMNVTTERGGFGRLFVPCSFSQIDGVKKGTDLDLICNYLQLSAPYIVEIKKEDVIK